MTGQDKNEAPPPEPKKDPPDTLWIKMVPERRKQQGVQREPEQK